MNLDQIDESIKSAQARVDKAERAKALYDNALFKELVVEGYFRDEAVRTVSLYGSGSIVEREGLERDMHAIGAFRKFLANIVEDGKRAHSDLEVARNQRDAVIATMQEVQTGEILAEVDPDYAGSLGA